MLDPGLLPSILPEGSTLVAVIAPTGRSTMAVTATQIDSAVRWVDGQLPSGVVDPWAVRADVLAEIRGYVIEDGFDTDSARQVAMRALWLAWRDPSLNERFEDHDWLVLTVTAGAVDVVVGTGDEAYGERRDAALAQTSAKH